MLTSMQMLMQSQTTMSAERTIAINVDINFPSFLSNEEILVVIVRKVTLCRSPAAQRFTVADFL